MMMLRKKFELLAGFLRAGRWMTCAALAGVLLHAMGGCAMRSGVGAISDGGENDDGSALLDDSAWPARSPDGLEFLVQSPTGPRRVTRSSFGFHDGQPFGFTYRTRAKVVRVERAGLGVIREIEKIEPTEGEGASGPAPLALAAGSPTQPARILQFFSSSTRRESVPRPRWGGPAGISTPSEFELLPPTGTGKRAGDAGAAGASRGVIVHLRSMGGESYERPVIEELRSRGWWVISSEFPWSQWRGRRVDVNGVGEIDDAGAMLARVLDDRLAEWAYGAEAALEYLSRHEESASMRPLVVMGFSAGALGTPTVAARLIGRVGAVVIVGGGVNLLELSQTSELTDAGIRLRWRIGDKPPPGGSIPAEEALARVYAAYLRESRLDPYSTAPVLAASGKPVLQLHAALDSIVPARLGDQLHDRLGRHECWTFPLGHKLMFWRLKEYRTEIADWVERHTAGEERRAG